MELSNSTIFWLSIGTAVLLLIINIIYVLSIKTIVSSDFFKKRLAELYENSKGKASILLMIGAFFSTFQTYAQEIVETETSSLIEVSDSAISVLIGLDIFLFVMVVILHFTLIYILKQTKSETELLAEENSAKSLGYVLNDFVPIEKEETILMHHEYDGIQELDNNLPPWWKYGFYLTIVWAVLYFSYYHVFEKGDSQAKAYEKEMEMASIQVQEHLKRSALNIDENTVTMLTGAAELKEGGALFSQYCAVCHGKEGQGVVGPNLTDNYWIYGNSINKIFATVKNGANNGMKSWKDELNPLQIQQVSSFIKSLEGSNPANPKEPQGELVVEATKTNTDTTVVNN